MKALLFKEIKLAMHPTTYLFMAIGAMLMIPSYPYYVAFVYTCLGIFFIFLSARENKDIFFTASLPVRKSDVVKISCLHRCHHRTAAARNWHPLCHHRHPHQPQRRRQHGRD